MKAREPAPQPPAPLEPPGSAGELARSAADEWSEESSRQAAALAGASDTQRLFSEFRRKLAMGEAVSRALEKLAQALHFSGRITLVFHQGRLTKTVLEESYFRGRAAM